MQALDPYLVAKNISKNLYEANKSREDRNLIDKVLEQQRMGGGEQEGIAKILSRVSPERQQIPLQLLQKQQEQKAKQNVHANLQQSFNRIAELAPSLGIGSGTRGVFGGEVARKSGEFQSLNAILEGALTPIINPRGTLTDTKFKYIIGTILPKPTDSVAKIQGKLKGVAEMLGLDPSALGVKQSQNVSTQFNTDTIPMRLNGEIFDIPKSQYQEAVAQGYTDE